MHYLKSIASICLLFLLLVAASSCSNNQQEEKEKSNTNEVTAEQENVVAVDTFTLEKKPFKKEITTPGELSPFETVDIHPKIEGFIQKVFVDRGTRVKKGQLLASLVAPELEAQIREAQSRVSMAGADSAEANSKYLSAKGYYERLNEAAQTPGVISEHELATAKMASDAARSHVQALQSAKMSKNANVASLSQVKSYLQLRSPINGVITERNLHPGALVGPSGVGGAEPILKIQDVSHLRLLVAIPERYYSSVHVGASVPFKVSAYPDKTFTGRVSRPSFTLNEKNRTETVELDVENSDNILSPGMYAEVIWPVARPEPTFMVPSSTIVETTERTFVQRVKNDQIELVDIRKGFSDKDKVEIFGNLSPGDVLVTKASDEYREGTFIKRSVPLIRKETK